MQSVDLGDVDKVLEEYDNVMQERAVPENAFGLVDASSLLWRLEVCSQVVKELVTFHHNLYTG